MTDKLSLADEKDPRPIMIAAMRRASDAGETYETAARWIVLDLMARGFVVEKPQSDRALSVLLVVIGLFLAGLVVWALEAGDFTHFDAMTDSWRVRVIVPLSGVWLFFALGGYR